VKGQLPVAFAVVKDPTLVETTQARQKLEAEVKQKVDELLGAIARPHRVYFVSGLPKTRSGKMRRADPSARRRARYRRPHDDRRPFRARPDCGSAQDAVSGARSAPR